MCIVNSAIEAALRDAREAYEGKDIRVEAHLEATADIETHGDALHAALYTVFRALPDRVVPGSKVVIRTRDRAGGDVELTWERTMTAESAEDDALDTRELLRKGRHGDLMDLALVLLEEFCRARTGFLRVETSHTPHLGSEGAQGGIYRRVLALIPTQAHCDERYGEELEATRPW